MTRTVTISEAQLQDAVIEMAQTFGWMVAHFRPAQTSKGWRTAVSADGAGFPDLVLVRAPRVIFAELKSEAGRVSSAQQQWAHVLRSSPGVSYRLWTPHHWRIGDIEQDLLPCTECAPTSTGEAAMSSNSAFEVQGGGSGSHE